MSAAWARARNVLCVRLDGLGDVLMTTPAMRAIKGASRRRLTLLSSAAGIEAARWVPEVDERIAYDAPWMKGAARPGEDAKMITLLARRKFDAAVIFTVYSQNPLPAALLCHLAGIPLRLAHCRENPYRLLTDWVPEPEPAQKTRHEVRRQLDLVQSVGCRTADDRLSFRVPDASRLRWQRWVDRNVGPDRPWVVIHPGASAPSRRYAPEGFAAAADILALEHGWRVVFTGSAAENSLIEGIRGRMAAASLSLAGRQGLDELAALISLAPVFISNNTGPSHVAAAVGTPVVNLYALTNPQHTPWGVPHRILNHDVPCANCYRSVCPEAHHDCLRLVRPESVADAAVELAEEAPEPSRPAVKAALPALAGPDWSGAT